MKQVISILFTWIPLLLWSQSKPINIGIVLDHESEKTRGLIQELKQEIQAVAGKDATIVFPQQAYLINEYDIAKAERNYQTLLQQDVDLILAIGIVNQQWVSSQSTFPKPTILLGTFNSEKTHLNTEQQSSCIKNFNYLVESHTIEEDLIAFSTLYPFQKVGIAVEKSLAEAIAFRSILEKSFLNIHSEFAIIPFDTPNDILNNKGDVDAIYMAGGFHWSTQQVQAFADSLVQLGIPSFTQNGIEQVESGLMATLQPEGVNNQLLRKVAINIDAYINGTPLNELPINVDYTPNLTINYNTAFALNIPLKNSLIAQANVIGDFKNPIAQKQYNLIDAIGQALDKNLSLASSKKNIEINEQNFKKAKSNYLPSLNATAGVTHTDPEMAKASNGQRPEFLTNGSVTLDQTLFSEGVNANITIQKNLLNAQKENFNAQELNTVFNVSNTYFNTLILKANAQIQLRNLNLTKKNLLIAEQNLSAGQSGKSDVLRFVSQKSQNTQAMIQAANQLEQSFNELNRLINNPIDYQIDIENIDLEKGIFEKYNHSEVVKILDDPKLREPFIQFLIEEAKANAPELKALDYNMAATDRSVRLKLLPTIGFRAQANRTFDRSGVGSTPPSFFPQVDQDYNVGINMSFPVFNRNQLRIQKHTALIQKDQLLLNKENQEQAMTVNIRNNVLNLSNQVANIELSKVTEKSAFESLELIQTSYANGAVSVIQLIDAQNNYINAQLAQTNAIYQYLINLLQLERQLGHFFILENNNQGFIQRFLEQLPAQQ